MPSKVNIQRVIFQLIVPAFIPHDDDTVKSYFKKLQRKIKIHKIARKNKPL